MEDQEERVTREVERLIHCFHSNPSEETKQRLLESAAKIVSSEGTIERESMEEAMHKIAAKVGSTRDRGSVQQCTKALQCFANNHTFSNKSEILGMLTVLSGMVERDEEDVPKMLRPLRQGNLSIDRPLQINILPIDGAIKQEKEGRVIRNRRDIFQGITEADIVKELSHVFTNTNKKNMYKLRSNIEVSGTIREIVSDIADLGWLHKRITAHQQREGVIAKALAEAIHAQLKQFYIWNNNLQPLIKESKLSLRKLHVKSFMPKQVLVWLATILDAVGPFSGCEIISMVNLFRPNGSQAANSLINRILSSIIRPLLKYIHNWMYMGVLYDPHSEFFIAENSDVVEWEEWRGRFTLMKEKIPNILDECSAMMIFSTGKAISFLKNKCKINYNIRTPFIAEENVEVFISKGFDSFIQGDFMSWLSEVYKEVNHVLCETLFGQFHLKYHLQSMKHFYLLGKADFVQQLYDVLKGHLSVKGDEIYFYTLDGIISDAIVKCFTDINMPNSLDNYRTAVAFRLLAKMINFQGGNDRWDYINFQYSLQKIQPLKNVFSPSIITNYQRIFSFLWKVKQIKEILNDIWIVQSKQSLKINGMKNGELSQICHLVYLLRNTMTHFMTSLHSYLKVAIESSWNAFEENVDKTINFDDILDIHCNFQQQILEITFNTPKEKDSRGILIDIFAIINKFRINYENLQDHIDQCSEIYRCKREQMGMSKRSTMSQPVGLPSFHEYHATFKAISLDFNVTFKRFYSQIKKERTYLQAKLNFSEYYSRRYME